MFIRGNDISDANLADIVDRRRANRANSRVLYAASQPSRKMSGRSHAPLNDERRRWCHNALQGTSRTFAITVDVLEEPMATQICVGYLLCRVADTVEDARHIPPDEQVTLLEMYRRALDPHSGTDIGNFRAAVDPWLPVKDDRNGPDDGQGDGWNIDGWRDEADADDWRLVAHAPRVVRAFEAFDPTAREAIREPIRDLVGGMAMFIERHADTGGIRVETVEELEEYCWYAAGTVGTLITNLLTRDTSPRRTRRLRANDRSFALLLQLVNVAKDVTDDYHEENNVYLPATWLREHGVEPDGVCDPENASAVAAVIRRIAGHARDYAGDARAYLEAMPEAYGNTLAAWGVPYLLAVGTLRELDEHAEEVLSEGGVKVSRAEVLAIMERFSRGVDRSSLEALRAQVARGRFQQRGRADD
jgi:farnesyl-diphosphate farnesyltransferase